MTAKLSPAQARATRYGVSTPEGYRRFFDSEWAEAAKFALEVDPISPELEVLYGHKGFRVWWGTTDILGDEPELSSYELAMGFDN